VNSRYRVLDLFAGFGGWGQAFADEGHEVVSVDFEPLFNTTVVADINKLSARDLPGTHWDIVLASPPCQKFSITTVYRHWEKPGKVYWPKSDEAHAALRLVASTLRLIEEIQPTYWTIENPRGLLRKLPIMTPYERRTVTFCQYGDSRMKPTDLWGVFPNALRLKPTCRNGDACHIQAPRGSSTGTQGRKSIARAIRSAEGVYAYGGFIPKALSLDFLRAMEADDAGLGPKPQLQERLF
jgi:hypothetical protein